MTIKMFNPEKRDFPNGKSVFIGKVYEHPDFFDGKLLRSAFVKKILDNTHFLDEEGVKYEIIDKEPEVTPPHLLPEMARHLV